MATKKSQIKFKFNCDACGFYTNNNYDYKRHVKTKKHEKSTENAKKQQQIFNRLKYLHVNVEKVIKIVQDYGDIKKNVKLQSRS